MPRPIRPITRLRLVTGRIGQRKIEQRWQRIYRRYVALLSARRPHGLQTRVTGTSAFICVHLWFNILFPITRPACGTDDRPVRSPTPMKIAHLVVALSFLMPLSVAAEDSKPETALTRIA